MPKKSIEKKSLLFTPELEPTIALDKKNDIVYKNDNGELYWGDCIDYMSTIKNGSVDLIFADPPYNIKKDKWDCWDNMEEYLSWSRKWIAEASRVLKLDGTLYVCGFSEIIALILPPRFFEVMQLFSYSPFSLPIQAYSRRIYHGS